MALKNEFSYLCMSSIETAANFNRILKAPIARIAMVGVAIGAALGLSGCGEEPIREGRVIEKVYEDARIERYLIPIPHTTCFGTGTSRSCITNFTYIPAQRYDDEDYMIRIEKCVDGGGPSSCKRRWLEVAPSLFNILQIGDYYKPEETASDDSLRIDKPLAGTLLH